MEISLLKKDDPNEQLVDSQLYITNHLYRYISSMSLKCAIELGIPDIVHSYGKPITLSKLMNSLPAIDTKKTEHVHRLMRLLVHSGFFSIQKLLTEECQDQDAQTEGYMLTTVGQLLRRNHPSSISSYVLLMLSPTMIQTWNCLSNWLQSDRDYETPFHMRHGKTLWDLANHIPEFNVLFNEGMDSDSRLAVNLLTRERIRGLFEGSDSLVDVGGGIGMMAKVIAQAYPHLQCVCFDLPHVVVDLEGSENLTFVGGDMFQAIPPTDVVLLKWILHDWNDEDCVKILKRCKEAVSVRGKRGKVIVIDMVMGSSNDGHLKAETKYFLDLQMMVAAGGKERTEEEWRKLFMDAGFTGHNLIVRQFDLRAIMEIYV